jgi:hypothetical protein
VDTHGAVRILECGGWQVCLGAGNW